MQKIYYIILLIVFTAFFFSCQKAKQYPPEPEITFKNCNINTDTTDALGNQIYYNELVFSVIDGDGDIGSSTDSNFFYILYVKENGDFRVYYIPDSINYYKIPYIIQPGGTNKTIMADIKIEFTYNPSVFTYDTIKYDFYIIDRAGHKSNTECTPSIIFSEY